MGGDCENKGGEEENMVEVVQHRGVGYQTAARFPDGSNCGITAHWGPIHGAKILHVLTHAQALARKGRCASTHGANGLLLKTCITPRRLATTHVAAGRSRGGDGIPALHENGRCIVHHVTMNDTKQCPD